MLFCYVALATLLYCRVMMHTVASARRASSEMSGMRHFITGRLQRITAVVATCDFNRTLNITTLQCIQCMLCAPLNTSTRSAHQPTWFSRKYKITTKYVLGGVCTSRARCAGSVFSGVGSYPNPELPPNQKTYLTYVGQPTLVERPALRLR